MAEFIKVKILSNEKILVDTLVKYVFIPTSSGTLQMLPKHCNYTGLLTSGVISYQDNDDSENQIKISGGVCSLIKDEIQILVEA